MRTLTTMLIAVAALAFVGHASAATQNVKIYGSGFRPASLTITAGDTVRFINEDNEAHQVLANDSSFVSPILRPLASWSVTLRTAGTYHYYDELHPKLKGVVYVKGLPASLTLAASAPIVTYGTQVTLSGVVSNHASGEQVTITYQPYPQPSPIVRATVVTGAGGTFSFIVEPQVLTSYDAAWKGAYAAPTTVEVAPKVTLGRDNGWIIHVAGGSSFAGRSVQFQRLNLATGQWVTLRMVLLNARSSAKLIYPLPKGASHIRVAMSVNQAGAGYLGAFSPIVIWHV